MVTGIRGKGLADQRAQQGWHHGAHDARLREADNPRRMIPAHALESLWRAPDRAQIRRIDWSGRRLGDTPPRGSLLFVPGRADFYEKYLETLDHWHQQGWRVTALDWRWQAGSGRYHRDPRLGGTHSFGSWINDLADFWKTWVVASPGPHVLIGHSMGGHLALRAAATGAVRPDALVLSAPMLGFVTPIPSWIQNAYANLMCRIGDPARAAWKDGERPGDSAADRGQRLTHDPQRYADEVWWRQRRPELNLGPASWDWVRKASASLALLRQPGLLEAVDLPVLMLGTPADSLVAWPAIRAAAARLPQSQLVDLGPGSAHEILRETDEVRDRVLAAIDGFLAQVAMQHPAP